MSSTDGKLTDAQLGRVVRGLVAKAESCEVVQIYRYNARIQADESVREYEVSLNGSSLHEGDTLDEALLAAASAAGVDVGEPDAAEVHTRLLESTLKTILDADDTQELGKIAGAKLGENVIVPIIRDYRRKLGEVARLREALEAVAGDGKNILYGGCEHTDRMLTTPHLWLLSDEQKEIAKKALRGEP